MHPQLVNRINAILARTLFVPPQGNAENEEDIMDSLVVAADATAGFTQTSRPTSGTCLTTMFSHQQAQAAQVAFLPMRQTIGAARKAQQQTSCWALYVVLR